MSLLRPNIPLCLWFFGGVKASIFFGKKTALPIANKSPMGQPTIPHGIASACWFTPQKSQLKMKKKCGANTTATQNLSPIHPKLSQTDSFGAIETTTRKSNAKKMCVTGEWKTHYSNTNLPSCHCCSCRSPQCPSYFAPGKNAGREVANRLWLGSSIYGIRHLGDILTRD